MIYILETKRNISNVLRTFGQMMHFNPKTSILYLNEIFFILIFEKYKSQKFCPIYFWNSSFTICIKSFDILITVETDF